MATKTPTPTPKPMTKAQETAVERHRLELLKSYRASAGRFVNIRFEKGTSYNGAPVMVNIKRQPTDEGVSTYSLPKVYLDAVRFLVQCAGFSPARARREIGEAFVELVEALPEGRDPGRRLAKAFVRGLLPLAEDYGHKPEIDGRVLTPEL